MENLLRHGEHFCRFAITNLRSQLRLDSLFIKSSSVISNIFSKSNRRTVRYKDAAIAKGALVVATLQKLEYL
jgi:hypothetical protein